MPSIRSLPEPQKKRRKVAHDTGVAADIKNLEDSLGISVKANTSLNKLADLVDLVVNQHDPQIVSKGIYALYRIFTLIISTGKLSISGDDSVKAVKTWLWERLHAYTDFLVGLMKDEEKVLRVSFSDSGLAYQSFFYNAYRLLPCKFCSHFKSTCRQPKARLQIRAHPAPSSIWPISEKLFLAYCCARRGTETVAEYWILTCYMSFMRPGSAYTTIFGGSSCGSRCTSLHQMHTDKSSYRYSSILEKTPKSSQLSASKNFLSILEKLSTFPTEQAELNEWWVSGLGSKPPKPKSANDGDDEDEPVPKEDEDEVEDDWRKFFEDEPVPQDTKQKSSRLHKLTIHQSLHSLSSHKAVFTRAWLTLLSRLAMTGRENEEEQQEKKVLAVRVLNVMHRGVLPHLTRPVLVMDWIAGCVDHGGSLGLLALNALFTLMKDYNLCVSRSSLLFIS